MNSEGTLEIPHIALEELLANALIHRDYFVPAPVRVFIYDDRVEIVNPGHLQQSDHCEHPPQQLNIATPSWPHSRRNFCRTGALATVSCALTHPGIEFVDDRDANLFRAILPRPTASKSVGSA